MLKIINIVVILSLMTFCFNVLAQEKNVESSNQQWIQYYNQLKLSDEWALLADAGFRWKEKLENKSQYITRFGIGYQLHKNICVATGVAFLGYYASDKRSKMEFRPYQELIFKQNFEKIKIQHRFRTEQRFFNQVVGGEITGEDFFNWRFRYRFFVTVPILNLSANNPEGKLSLNIGDEIFINAGKEIVNNVFDQNRVLIGPVFQINKNISVSLTYNAQFASTTIAGTYRYTSVLWLGIKQNIDTSE